jgi:hypothetical protein
VHITFFHVRKCMISRASICKRLWSPGRIEELIPPGWESIPGLLEGLQLRALLIEIMLAKSDSGNERTERPKRMSSFILETKIRLWGE